MRLKQGDAPFKIPGSDSPLKKSASVSAILQGDTGINQNYYVDSLQRFKRDHATVDKQQREARRQRDDAIREKRRIVSLGREQHHKEVEEQNVQKMMRRQSQSIQLHQMGSKLSIHSHGAAVDPVSQRYENTDKGRRQEQKDKDKRIDTLVRTHHLQTCGTSGYNIINGQSLQPIQEMVGNRDYPQFQNKLSNYYEKFRIKLN